MDKNFLSKLDRLIISTRRLIRGSGGGMRRSSGKGSSIEFSDFREYSMGDDFRHIDWNAYARFDRLFVKLFMEEQETMVTIFLDTSRSMDFGDPNKGSLGKELGAVFSYIALSGLDRVTIATIRDMDVKKSDVFAGKQNFFKSYNYMEGIEFEGETYISQALKRAYFLNPRGGISIVISDLFSKDGYREGLDYLLYKNQDVLLFNILSPQEMDPSLEGSIELIDSEDGSKFNVIANASIMRNYRENVESFINENREYCHSRGIYYVPIISDMDIERIVFDELMTQGILR